MEFQSYVILLRWLDNQRFMQISIRYKDRYYSFCRTFYNPCRFSFPCVGQFLIWQLFWLCVDLHLRYKMVIGYFWAWISPQYLRKCNKEETTKLELSLFRCRASLVNLSAILLPVMLTCSDNRWRVLIIFTVLNKFNIDWQVLNTDFV